MIPTKEDRNTERKTKTCVTLPTTYFKTAVKVMNPGLHGEQLRTNRLSHDTAKQRFMYNPVMQSDIHIGIPSLPLLATPLTHHAQVIQLADTVW
jgi:hypothetical protein